MSARMLDGVVCSKVIREEVARGVQSLGVSPGLRVIQVGHDDASTIYVRNKIKAARAAGFNAEALTYPTDVTEANLLDAIRECNRDSTVHGYLIQLPLPTHIDGSCLISEVCPAKDVDGLHPFNQGMLLRGTPTIIPATPRGVLEILRRNSILTKGRRVVILGRSLIVGRPLAAALLVKGDVGDATVTVVHSQSANLCAVCHEADILVSAIGRSRFVTREFVKEGAVVVDVGINRDGGKLCGDVDFESVSEVASAITPVPGGIGPMTIAMLLMNTLEAAQRAVQKK